MPDSTPQFEITDSAGLTKHYNGPAGSTTPFQIPPSPLGVIAEIAILNDPVNPAGRILEVSFDGGTTYYPVLRGGTMTWTPKGFQQQVWLKPSHAGMNYYTIVNLDPP